MTFDFDWRASCMDAERRYMEMKRDRDRWRKIAEHFADAGTNPTAHAIALEFYENEVSTK